MPLQTFEIALNGVTNIHHCFVTSFPLRDAAGQNWAFGDEHAVFIGLNCDAKFHVASVAIAGRVRNARKSLCTRNVVDLFDAFGFAQGRTAADTAAATVLRTSILHEMQKSHDIIVMTLA